MPKLGKRLLVLAALLAAVAGSYLFAANLFLSTPLGPWVVNRRPERLRVTWGAAWSLWPGRVTVRRLEVRGHVRNVDWSITAERARGWIDLPGLLERRFHVSWLRAEGVRSRTAREGGRPAPPAPAPPRRRRPPWTVRFDDVAATHVREVVYNAYRLEGDGRAAGGFTVVPGGDFRVDRSTARMPASRLFQGADAIARDLDLETAASIAPHAPRRHPGVRGYDFITGTLRARGRVPRLALRAEQPEARPLVLDLRLERGRLAPGSRIAIGEPTRGPGAGERPDPAAFALAGAVRRSPEGPRLVLRFASDGFAAGRRKDRAPVLEIDALRLVAATSETRLSALLASARELKREGELPSGRPFPGSFVARGLRLDAGDRLRGRLEIDRLRGRIDVAALARREVALDGLEGQGAAVRLALAAAGPPPAAGARRWSVRLAGARLAGVREIAWGDDLRLQGDGRLAGGFAYDPDGDLEVSGVTLAFPAGRLLAGRETSASEVSLRAEARVAPFAPARIGGAEALRFASGRVEVRGRVASLGFLRPYFARTPWLSFQGRGRLAADLRVAAGRLEPGTRLTVRGARIEAVVLDSVATGNAAVSATVEPRGGGAGGAGAPRARLAVGFDRFAVAPLAPAGQPPYLRGRGLRIEATSADAVDLTEPDDDLRAVVDLPDAEVPDLSVYNLRLPPGTGAEILPGRGRARLHLELAAGNPTTARGTAALRSEAARLRFQGLEVAGRFALRAPLASPDLAARRFDFTGAKLDVDGLTYRQVEAAPGGPEAREPWWLRLEVPAGSLVWGKPVALRSRARVVMRDSGPLLALFAERSRFLAWFDDLLRVEDVHAQGELRAEDGAIEIDDLRATGGPVELRARMRFANGHRRGDLFVRYGRLAAGIELRDRQRDVKLLRPLQWYESRPGLR